MNFHERIRALRKGQTCREAGAQSLWASKLGGSRVVEQRRGNEAPLLGGEKVRPTTTISNIFHTSLALHVCTG